LVLGFVLWVQVFALVVPELDPVMEERLVATEV
jgi:hypothetical protein